MKKNLIKTLLIFSLAFSFLLVSCGGDDTEKKTTPTQEKDVTNEEDTTTPDETETPDEAEIIDEMEVVDETEVQDEVVDTETVDEEPADIFACDDAACETTADCDAMCGEGVSTECPNLGPFAGKCMVVDCDPEDTSTCPEGKQCKDMSMWLPDGTPYTHVCS